MVHVQTRKWRLEGGSRDAPLIDSDRTIAHNEVMVIDAREVIAGFNFTKAAEESTRTTSCSSTTLPSQRSMRKTGRITPDRLTTARGRFEMFDTCIAR